jgi:hypothetical protein
MRIRSILFSFVAVAVVGCTDPVDTKGTEDDANPALDGKLDSQRKPTDHGNITSGVAVQDSLVQSAKYHAWEFDLTGPADISFDTSKVANGKDVDTVMYLYKQAASGSWGAYLARNDDAGASVFSSLDRNAGAGHYRVLIKGFKTTTYGDFQLSYACSGAGCPVVCGLGGTFYDLRNDPRFAFAPAKVLTAASTISALQGKQVIRAMHASTHTDVTTAAEAFASADQGEINEYAIESNVTGKTYTAMEYGAGDNSYGAIFAAGSTTVVAEIHDGDFYDCTVQ